MNPEIEKIWNVLQEVPDPEIPVISVVELGVVRAIEKSGEKIIVSVTPTYTGCPAMKMMEDDIVSKLKEKGYTDIQLRTVLSPAWTTDWLSDATKEKLRRYGIAPPEKSTADKNALLGKPREVKCPRCGSAHTSMISQFGSTACKALWKCDDCQEPFDYFKCI
ncbi:MAG: ring-1,2-phenylacetyl-CoA epoxidase subunit PaaD [Bacteroidetes bacterium]|nr:MAG: ring-1,2-phenylacetyl-CoA epoxidase subunit PaaD [Bacteroidota bacterium]